MSVPCLAFAALLATGGLNSPADPRATASSEVQIDLTWRDTSSNETGFEVGRSTSGPSGTFALIGTTGANAATYSDAGLNASTQYCYQVRAYRRTGGRTTYSQPSATACATTLEPVPPAAPSNARAVPASDSQIDFTWRDNSSNETGFELYRSNDPASAFALLVSTGPGVVASSDRGLYPSTQYCYKVRAFNTGGGATSYSEFSTPSCATTLAPLPPAAPSDTRVYTASASSMAIYWVDNSSTETGFEIHRSSAGPSGAFALVVTVGANATGASDGGLSAQTEYCYKVRAVRSGGGTTAYSDFSNTACATTQTPPGLHLKTVTTGVDLPTNGYQADIWSDWGMSYVYVGRVDLPVGGTVDVPDLMSGDYLVEFRGSPANCILSTNSWQRVYVGNSWQPGVTAEFDLNCTPPRQLAFAKEVDGNIDIYLANSLGGAVTRLTTDPASDLAPAWSPDGTMIAFQSNRTGTWEIFLMNADGSDPVQLTGTGSSSGPAWSPDGTRIAFTSYGQGYVIDVDGTGLQTLSNGAGEDLAWSPDGTKIAFRSGYVIYVMNADGSGLTLVTNDEFASDASPAWSPDGAWLFVARSWCPGCVSAISRLSAADGSAMDWATADSECATLGEPNVASDGTVAFTDYDLCAGTTTVNFAPPSGGYGSGTPITEGFIPRWRP